MTPATVLLALSSRDDRVDECCDRLRGHGIRPVMALDGQTALRLARTADVIVTDTLLPGAITGWDLIRCLRHDQSATPVAIIVWTDCTWPSERERAYAAGCDGFVDRSRPVDELVLPIRAAIALGADAGHPGSAITTGRTRAIQDERPVRAGTSVAA